MLLFPVTIPRGSKPWTCPDCGDGEGFKGRGARGGVAFDVSLGVI